MQCFVCALLFCMLYVAHSWLQVCPAEYPNVSDRVYSAEKRAVLDIPREENISAHDASNIMDADASAEV